jgi:hypothetical protein
MRSIRTARSPSPLCGPWPSKWRRACTALRSLALRADTPDAAGRVFGCFKEIKNYIFGFSISQKDNIFEIFQEPQAVGNHKNNALHRWHTFCFLGNT